MDESMRPPPGSWRASDATPTTPPYVPSRTTDPGRGPYSEPLSAEAELVNAAAAARRYEAEHERSEALRGRYLARTRAAIRAMRIVDVLFSIVYALLAVRFLLVLFGANPDAGFARFIYTASWPVYAPFANIVASPTFGDGHVVAVPVLIALVAYAILHAIVNAIIRAATAAPHAVA